MSRPVMHLDSGVESGASARRAPLFGREKELAELRAVVAAAAEGEGRLVLVAGSAGMGKTALTEHVAADAMAGGAVVLTGHAYDLGTAAPYEPWIDLLRAYRAADGLPALPAGLGNAELLETLAGKDALFEQVAGFLLELTTIAPAVLVLEDLHWSDQASLELLRAVTRTLASARLLVIATFRDDELIPGQPLHRVLPSLVREARPVRIDLRPLDREGVRRLVAARYALSEPDAARLTAHLLRSGEGSPFYVGELLRTLEHERLLHQTEEGWTLGDLALAPVPPLVRQLIEDRVARLGPAVQRMLQVAATIGPVATPELWQAAAGEEDDVFADAVDLARQAKLIEETPDRAALRFTHALIREAIYDGMALPRRRSWHRRVGELLAGESQPDPEAAAHHLLQGGSPEAASWLLRAAQRAERHDASWDAVARYEQVLPLLERSGSRAEKAWLHADLAESYRYIDPMRSSLHLDAAEPLARDIADPVLTLTIWWLRARLRGFLGQGVVDELRACVVALEALSPSERERLRDTAGLNPPSRGLFAQWIAFHGRYDEAIVSAEAAIRNVGSPGSALARNELGGAQIALGLAHAGLGRPDEARTAFAAARDHYRTIGSGFMTASTLKWEWIEVAMAYATDDLDYRRQVVDEYTRTMAGLSSFAVFHGPHPLPQIFGPALLDGRWADVRESALAYLSVPAWRVSALAALGVLERRQGRPAAAWSRVQSGIPGGPEAPPGNLYFVDSLRLQRLAAALAMDAGEPQRALAWIEANGRWLDWSGRVLDRAAHLLLRARHALAGGDREQATALAKEALTRANEPRQPLSQQAAHRFLGVLAAQDGDIARASRHLETALSVCDACALPYERSSTLVEQARLLLGHGRNDAAAPLLQEARAVFTRLGATAALERLDSLEPGSRARSSAVAKAPAGLSPREIEVLRLVARGLSYADVGGELFISPGTVARHLQSIYGKLGVDSRAEAAAFAFEQGLVRDG